MEAMLATAEPEMTAATTTRLCTLCKKWIAKGSAIKKVQQGSFKVWVHEDCDLADSTRAASVDVDAIVAKVIEELGGRKPEIDIAKLADQVGPIVSDGVAEAVSGYVADTVKEAVLASTKAVIQYVDEKVLEKPVERVEIRNSDTGKLVVVDDLVHEAFAKVLKLAARRKNIFLPWPAGCGKSHLAGQVAKALGLPFAMISLSAGVSEAKLIGRTLPNVTTGQDSYNATEFVRLYENGGVFLFDEIDAADPNVLLVINSALANGYLALDRRENPIAKRHPDFIAIAAANTFGRGADRQYVGRAPLDESTLDRFRIGTVPMDYDQRVERALCPDESLRETLTGWREAVRANRLERVVSTRFMVDAYDMLTRGGFSMADIEASFFAGWREDEVRKVKGRA